MAKPIFVLNGPNLNLLGEREPSVYGKETLADVEKRTRDKALSLGHSIEFRQTNLEGELITWVQEARLSASGLIINAGAYTHSSIALFDALSACAVPIVEVHLSNIYARESFRHHSYVSPSAWGVLCGFGPLGYELAVTALASRL
jgi:3-dehydroquinate dehydratase II